MKSKNVRATSLDVNAHTANFCLDCGSANDKSVDACPKCGSRRHRAYRKEGDACRK